jgi:glycosyltransferase involved in cell wall biosynthesis
MKVYYDSGIFEIQKYGGVSRYFVKLFNNLNKVNNVNLKVVSPLYVNNYLKICDNKKDIIGLKSPKFKGSTKIYSFINGIISRFIYLNFNPDIVHLSYYSLNLIKIVRKKSKLVITVHDMIHEKYPEYFSYFDNSSVNKLKLIEIADHIICVSNSTKSDLLELSNIDESKITVIHHGVDQVNSYELEKSNYFLFVGNRKGYKNFKMLLNALSINTHFNSKYDLILFGGGKLTNEEKSLIQYFNINPNKIKIVLGCDANLKELYRKAALYISTSLYEGFGMPILEAMSYGCPVACSNTSSMIEIVGNAGLLFDPLDPASISNKIDIIFDDPNSSKLYAKNSYLHSKEFTWKKCADKTHEVYKLLL